MIVMRISLALVLLCSGVNSQVTFVSAAAVGNQDGSSWLNAYTDLQSALASSTQGEIWVAKGNYFPGMPGQRSATFQLKNNVAIYGGFAGTETMRAQRNPQAHVTVLSGDIDQDDTYGTGLNWWQYSWSGSLGNSFHVVTGSGCDASAILDGVEIRAGRGDDTVLPGGAGLVVYIGSPTILNCTFRYNAVGSGSSARLIDCQSTFKNCIIKDAYTCNCGAGGWVSGILLEGNSNLQFEDCEFLNHYYVSSQGAGRGAALSIGVGCSASILRSKFIGNQTGNFYPIGGGTAYGGGVVALGNVVVDRCEFTDNFAHAGAGLTAWRNATITNSLFARNRAVSHPNTSGFNDGNYGAGLLTLGSSTNSVIRVANCSFVDNQCDKGAGAAFYGTSVAQVENCVFYDNYGYPPTPGEDIIPILKQQIVGNYTLSNCCVEGLLETEPGEDPPNASNFPGCFDDIPKFINAGAGDYHFKAASPCINSGLTTAALPPANLDLEGNPRTVGLVDIGCFEYSGSASPSMVSTNLIMGKNAEYRVFNAYPGETIYFLYTLSGVGAGPCTPQPSNICFDLNEPIIIARIATADMYGNFTHTAYVPVGLPMIDVWAQAFMARGPNLVGSVLTNVTQDTLQIKP